jgi:hypothetical protein
VVSLDDDLGICKQVLETSTDEEVHAARRTPGGERK